MAALRTGTAALNASRARASSEPFVDDPIKRRRWPDDSNSPASKISFLISQLITQLYGNGWFTGLYCMTLKLVYLFIPPRRLHAVLYSILEYHLVIHHTNTVDSCLVFFFSSNNPLLILIHLNHVYLMFSTILFSGDTVMQYKINEMIEPTSPNSRDEVAKIMHQISIHCEFMHQILSSIQ